MHLRPFEIGLIGVFALLALVGLFWLANVQTGNDPEDYPYGERVLIWGTLDERVFEAYLAKITDADRGAEVITYREVPENTFERELVNAIAEGESPDLIVLPHERLVLLRSKLYPVTSETIDPRTFRDTYIDGAEIFLMSDGLYGIPLAVDPLVMYWNRDIFAGNGFGTPPKTWETLVGETVMKTTILKDEQVLQSAVALGEYGNITHAKEVLSMLLLQAGTTLVEETVDGYDVTLNQGREGARAPGAIVLSFYTQFVIPGRELYTWNRSMPMDKKAFLEGKLALYFGQGSERDSLLTENANLNFDIAPVPQGEGATAKRVYGDFYAFAIPRASSNIQGAYVASLMLTNPTRLTNLLTPLGLAPVRRDMITTSGGEDLYIQVLMSSALIARGWLDPSPEESSAILRETVGDVSSGRKRIDDVIMDITERLEELFRNI